MLDALYLPDDLTEEQWDEINGANDDDDRLAVLEAINEERGDMDDAVAAMRAEVEANNA